MEQKAERGWAWVGEHLLCPSCLGKKVVERITAAWAPAVARMPWLAKLQIVKANRAYLRCPECDENVRFVIFGHNYGMDGYAKYDYATEMLDCAECGFSSRVSLELLRVAGDGTLFAVKATSYGQEDKT